MKKEQQKQHLIDIMRSDEELGLYDEQEKLEEVAQKYGKSRFLNKTSHMLGFIAVAKWQQQQNKNLYSEEDMKLAHKIGTIFSYGRKEGTKTDRENHFNEWFEQFKKK